MISKSSTLRAIQHLALFGDTDLFPRLPETQFFSDEKECVADLVANINTGQYKPVSSVEVLTPKSNLGFRIGHQLSAVDSLIFTAAVIDAAEGIEAIRESTSGPVAFSYRFDPDGEGRLFKLGRSFHDWLGFLANFSSSLELFADAQPVLETDIADFYQRIYFHRIENLLDDAGTDSTAGRVIRTIIQTCRSKQSFGLPVGSSASRILAEGVLCDTDKMLRDNGLTLSRFVDDYKIIANSRYNTHTILCRLAEHLMVTEGLTLNVSKTRISDTAKLQEFARAKLGDVFSSAEMQSFRQFLSSAYGDEDADAPEDETSPFNPFLSGDEVLDRLDEIERRDATDFSTRKSILRVLRAVRDFDVLRLVRDHRQLAYFLPRDFCRAVRAGSQDETIDRSELRNEILSLLGTPPVSELSYARVWLLNLFVNGTLVPDNEIVRRYSDRTSPLEERQIIFVRALLNDRAFFRDQKGRLGQAGECSKPALLIGASCLPADEYINWVDIAVRQLADPFAKEFGIWLKRRPPLSELLSV